MPVWSVSLPTQWVRNNIIFCSTLRHAQKKKKKATATDLLSITMCDFKTIYGFILRHQEKLLRFITLPTRCTWIKNYQGIRFKAGKFSALSISEREEAPSCNLGKQRDNNCQQFAVIQLHKWMRSSVSPPRKLIVKECGTAGVASLCLCWSSLSVSHTDFLPL